MRDRNGRRPKAAEDFTRLLPDGRGAGALFEQLGFEVTNVLMSKRLDGTPTGS